MKDIQPYEPLKANLDTAMDALHEKMLTLQQGINVDAPPIISAGDAHEVNKAIAVVEAGINAFTVEYQHMAQLNREMREQRDELKRRLESLKRLFKRGLGDDGDPMGDGDSSNAPDASGGGKRRRK